MVEVTDRKVLSLSAVVLFSSFHCSWEKFALAETIYLVTIYEFRLLDVYTIKKNFYFLSFSTKFV